MPPGHLDELSPKSKDYDSQTPCGEGTAGRGGFGPAGAGSLGSPMGWLAPLWLAPQLIPIRHCVLLEMAPLPRLGRDLRTPRLQVLFEMALVFVINSRLAVAPGGTATKVLIDVGVSFRAAEFVAPISMVAMRVTHAVRLEKRAALPVWGGVATKGHILMNSLWNCQMLHPWTTMNPKNQSCWTCMLAPMLLSQAFNWCGWKVVTPIDLERDPDLDISRASVRKAIYIDSCLGSSSLHVL